MKFEKVFLAARHSDEAIDGIEAVAIARYLHGFDLQCKHLANQAADDGRGLIPVAGSRCLQCQRRGRVRIGPGGSRGQLCYPAHVARGQHDRQC